MQYHDDINSKNRMQLQIIVILQQPPNVPSCYWGNLERLMFETHKSQHPIKNQAKMKLLLYQFLTNPTVIHAYVHEVGIPEDVPLYLSWSSTISPISDIISSCH